MPIRCDRRSRPRARIWRGTERGQGHAMSKTSVWAVVSALALVVAATWVVAYRSAPAPAVDANATAAPAPLAPVWTDAKWPFPIDQWGTGRAFVCKAADCGTEVTLYLRAKLGFCNCTTGVADD